MAFPRKTYGAASRERRVPLKSVGNRRNDIFDQLLGSSDKSGRVALRNRKDGLYNNSSSSSNTSNSSDALFKSPPCEEEVGKRCHNNSLEKPFLQMSLFGSRGGQEPPNKKWKRVCRPKRRVVVVDAAAAIDWKEMELVKLLVETKNNKRAKVASGSALDSPFEPCRSGHTSTPNPAIALLKPCSVSLTPLPLTLTRTIPTPLNCSGKRRPVIVAHKVFSPSPFHRANWLANARLHVLELCRQTEPQPFANLLSKRTMSGFSKIGEGSYGEVFRSGSLVLKVVPIEDTKKAFEDVLSEIVISKDVAGLAEHESSRCPNFIRLNRVSCARGRYPKKLLKEWKSFANRKETENECPDIFLTSQLYILFHFEDGGTDLESYQFENTEQMVSVVSQVALALAVAENALEFEHRDLHWGNVLVSPTELDDLNYLLKGFPISLPSKGVAVSIIDFTLSRLANDGCILYTDLSDQPDIFEGKGDYQFDIYREMRQLNGNEWNEYQPKTNVIWLHYMLLKLTTEKRYPRKPERPFNILRKWTRQVRQYSSATQFVQRVVCPKTV